jgi:catechol 2,3-dioxygenase-like lactoylglutathione lyase family enzyme
MAAAAAAGAEQLVLTSDNPRSEDPKAIIANIAASDPAAADSFYRDILGLELVMDHGWIRTYAGSADMTVQVSVASEGGSGTAVPDLSVEVDDLDEVLRRVNAANLPIAYGPASEPWGVRRFYLRDPLGRLVNILQHA